MGRLTDKYCIVGVGETAYTKDSGKTTRAMGAEAIRNAINDAGITRSRSFAGLTPTGYQSARTSFQNHVKFLQSDDGGI